MIRFKSITNLLQKGISIPMHNKSKSAIGSAILVALSTGSILAQSGAIIPQGGVGHARVASCVIVKRMGPADQVTSHLYSFGIRGKQFQFVEGKLPEGFPFHGRLTDHDVRNLQGRGAEVIVIEPHYTAEDLKQAREQCKGMTGETPTQASEVKRETSSTDKIDTALPTSGNAGSVEENAISTTVETSVTVDSVPPGAEIELDGEFIGNTPSTIRVVAGSHEITVKKKGFSPWTRKLKVTGGSIKVDAELEAQPAQ